MNLELISKQLQEILPNLKQMEDKMKGIEATDAQVKDILDRCKHLEGSFLDFGKQLAEAKSFRATNVGKEMTEEQKVDFVKFATGVYKAKTDPEGIKMVKEVQDKYRAKGMVEGTTTAGGYSVPTLFSKFIWNAAKQKSVALQEAQLMPLVRGYKLPVTRLATNISVAWENEVGGFNESTPVLTSNDLTAKKLGAYTLISNELLEDQGEGVMDDEGSMSVTDWLVNLYAQAFGEEIDDEAFNGDATVFTGVLNVTGSHLVLMDGGDYEFSDLDPVYISKMISQVPSSCLSGSKFYFSPQAIHYIRTMKDGAGRYIYDVATSSGPATLFGYPVVAVDKLPSTSASATRFGVFGNMKNFLIGTKGEMTVQIGKELKMLTDETVLVVKKRIAMLTALPTAFSIVKTSPSES